MKLCLIACLFLSAVSAEASPELNVQGFARCLRTQSPQINLPDLLSRYHFNDLDFLIFYLAAYPGERLPAVPSALQARANQRWGVRFESQGAALAEAFSNSFPRTPQDAFKSAISVCGEDVFCAALTTQNVLRAFGRYEESIVTDPQTGVVTDDNPDWFKNNREKWIAMIPQLQSSMIALRTDGQGDRFGEWYHVFGVLAYATHEMALGHRQSLVGRIVDLNNLLSKELTGNDEDPAKAQIDQDAVSMSWDLLSGTAADAVNCSSADAYVK